MTKVSELIGRKLDEWVARAEGHDLYDCGDGTFYNNTEAATVGYTADGETQWAPSTDPAQGQPIMERLHISSAGNYIRDGSGRLPEGEEWMCAARGGAMGVGPTMLVAGMRCRLAMVYGDEVPA